MKTNSFYRVAAFADGDTGGNPAGVHIGDALPPATEMQQIAKTIGYSETVFACPLQDEWLVRYYSPESEVPFCGHATIALAAILARHHGNGQFKLQLAHNRISVEGSIAGDKTLAALQSPPTRSKPITFAMRSEVLTLFGLKEEDLDSRIPPAWMHAGADHIVLALKAKDTLRSMSYSLEAGRILMARHGLVTIMLVWSEGNQVFHSRNAFASGGVYEDPATGAASAAFAGYLRDITWPHDGKITLIQGEDMGMRSIIQAEITAEMGASIRVSGSARLIADAEASPSS